MKRIITITAVYDISEFDEDELTPKELVKQMEQEFQYKRFSWDEGFESLSVEVEDK